MGSRSIQIHLVPWQDLRRAANLVAMPHRLEAGSFRCGWALPVRCMIDLWIIYGISMVCIWLIYVNLWLVFHRESVEVWKRWTLSDNSHNSRPKLITGNAGQQLVSSAPRLYYSSQLQQTLRLEKWFLHFLTGGLPPPCCGFGLIQDSP